MIIANSSGKCAVDHDSLVVLKNVYVSLHKRNNNLNLWGKRTCESVCVMLCYQMSPRMLALTKPRSSSIKTFFNSISDNDDYDIRDGDETARRLKALPKATMTQAVKETRPHV